MSFGNKLQLNKVVIGTVIALVATSGLLLAEQAKAASNCTGPTFDAGTRTLSLVCTESTDIHELSCSDASNPDTLFLSVNGLDETITCPPDAAVNTAPAVTVTGPVNGTLGANNTFTITGTDAEGGNITYQVDWDDNGVPDYVSLSTPSGTGIDVVQSWSTEGSYTFGARAIDSLGSTTSPWVEHTIIISPVVAEASCSPAPASYDCYDQYVTTGFLTGTYLGTVCQPVGAPAPSPWTFEMNTAEYTFNGNYPTPQPGSFLACTTATAPTASVEVQVNGGGWGSGDQTINPGDTVTIRWTSTDATTCTGTNVNTGGLTNSVGVTVTAPAPGAPRTYAVECSGPGGTVTDSIVVTSRQLPNLSSTGIGNPNITGTLDPVTGIYSSISISFGIENDGGSDTTSSFDYNVNVSVNGYNVNESGTVGTIVAGDSRSLSETFTNVPFGNMVITLTIDTNGDVLESNEGDNTYVRNETMLPTANMQITVDNDVVREGQTTVLRWDTGVSYLMNCSVSGPTISPAHTFTSDTARTGSRTIGPVPAKSEYLLSCIEPLTNTTFTESVSVEVIPSAEEI